MTKTTAIVIKNPMRDHFPHAIISSTCSEVRFVTQFPLLSFKDYVYPFCMVSFQKDRASAQKFVTRQSSGAYCRHSFAADRTKHISLHHFIILTLIPSNTPTPSNDQWEHPS